MPDKSTDKSTLQDLQRQKEESRTKEIEARHRLRVLEMENRMGK